MAINLNQFVEDLKSTNWNDPGTWHAAPKALVLLAILAVIPIAGYFFDTAGQIEAVELGHQEEDRHPALPRLANHRCASAYRGGRPRSSTPAGDLLNGHDAWVNIIQSRRREENARGDETVG